MTDISHENNANIKLILMDLTLIRNILHKLSLFNSIDYLTESLFISLLMKTEELILKEKVYLSLKISIKHLVVIKITHCPRLNVSDVAVTINCSFLVYQYAHMKKQSFISIKSFKFIDYYTILQIFNDRIC